MVFEKVLKAGSGKLAKDLNSTVSAINSLEKQYEEYSDQEKNKTWQTVRFIPSNEWTIGVLGIGAIGEHVALSLSNFGYDVKGWSRSKKNFDGITKFKAKIS